MFRFGQKVNILDLACPEPSLSWDAWNGSCTFSVERPSLEGSARPGMRVIRCGGDLTPSPELGCAKREREILLPPSDFPADDCAWRVCRQRNRRAECGRFSGANTPRTRNLPPLSEHLAWIGPIRHSLWCPVATATERDKLCQRTFRARRVHLGEVPSLPHRTRRFRRG